MTKQRPPKLLDLIAVTNSPDDAEVATGDVGTVVELLAPTALKSNSSTATDELAALQRST